MKHMMRKPLMSLILLALTVFGTAFLAYFRSDIAAGWEYVNRLYDETHVTVEISPEAGWDDLQMKTHKDSLIRSMPEVEDTLTVMECFYVPRDGTPLPRPEDTEDPNDGYEYNYLGEAYLPVVTDSIWGTNNLSWLAEYWGLELKLAPGLDAGCFGDTEDQIPCLVRPSYLEEQGIALGDTVGVSPTPWQNVINPDAKEFRLTVVGTFEGGIRAGERDILVPESVFLGGPKLFYYGDMMYRCYYRAYVLTVHPEFNREYDRIESELRDILWDLKGCTYETNARAMENAARPLTQKLTMQEALVLPLGLLLTAAAVVAAVLLGLGFDREVFLRRMWGEKRLVVFVRLSGAVALWLIVCVAVAAGAGVLTAGVEWFGWSLRHAASTALWSLAGAAVPIARGCGRNLVTFYQSKEEQ